MKYVLITIACLLTVANGLAQETLEKSVLASGATTASNNEVSLKGTIGQRFIGNASNNEKNVSIGFWESVVARMSTSIIEIDLTAQIKNVLLGQNYPNPADYETRINLRLPQQSEIQLILFDINGKRLGTIHKGTLNKGKYVFSTEVAHLPEGQYIYALLINNIIINSKPLSVLHGQ